MRKKLGLSIAAISAVTAFAFAGVACSTQQPSGKGEKTTYTVTFDANGGKFASGKATATKTVDKGGYVSDEEKPTRDKFVFYGWLNDENDIITVNLSATAIDGNTTFYAGWKQAVDITFYYNYADAPNGGVFMTDTIASGLTVTEPTAPTRTDYTFDCWTTDEAGDNVWTFATDKAMNNVDLYAQWIESGNGGGGDEQSEYTVTLHIGDQMTEHTVASGSTFDKPDDPDGDGFKEWRIGGLDGDAYDFTSAVTGNIHLYAYFEPQLQADEHNITYVLDDGTSTVAVNGDNPTVFTEGTAETLKDPTRPAYTFEGWYTDSAFSTKVTSVGEIETSDITLYAKWSYTYPFFVTGYDNRLSNNKWVTYSDFINGNAGKNDRALVPFVEGDGAERTWDGKTYVLERVYVTKGAAAQQYGYKIVADNNKWYGVNGSSANAADNLTVSDSGYYTIKIVADGVSPASIKVTATIRRVNVSFVLSTGCYEVDDALYKDGGKLDKPTILGHNVEKWYRDAALTTEWDFDNDEVDGDITLYSGEVVHKTVKIKYTTHSHLTWNNAVTEVPFGSEIDLSFTLDEAYNQSIITVKADGEDPDENGKYRIFTESEVEITVEGDIEKNMYTVTFNEEDGTKIGEATVKHGEGIDESNIPEAADLTAVGKEFVGWSGDINNVTQTKTVTAVYNDIDYTVKFYSNGGSDVDEQTLNYGNKIAEPQGVKKPDMVLKGWYTEPLLTNEWNFATGTMPARNVELYAKWEKDTTTVQWYNIYYKRNKADETAYNTVEVSQNGTVGKPASPTQAGYVFDKWFDAATDTEYVFGSSPTADVTLYATWTLKAPTLTVNNVSGMYKNGGYSLTAKPKHDIADAAFTYKWYKVTDGEQTELVGKTAATLNGLGVADSGEYKVEVTVTVGEYTSTATATATVAVSQAVLPAISGIGFSGGDAYTRAITFTAETTTLVNQYVINVYDSEGESVYTDKIAIPDPNKFDIGAELVGKYRVVISYADIEPSDNIDFTAAEAELTFKGAGTAACPFTVSSLNDIKRVNKYGDKYFVQTADITVGEGQTLTALFTANAQFTGTYDGGGYKVSGITDGRGLFGYIGSSATVKNLNLTVKINSNAAYIGGVAAENNGNVLNVTVSGSIVSTVGEVNKDAQKTLYGTGGIVGKNRAGAEVKDCTNNATVRGNITVGGLVGYNMAGATVKDSENNGAIGTASTAMSWAGGLVGLNGGTVVRSINTAKIQAPTGESNGNNYLSGLVSENLSGGVVTECINSGEVSGDYAATGLIAINGGTLECCVNTANVKARWTVSAIACTGTGGSVRYCISTGTTTKTGGGQDYVVGKPSGDNIASGTATNCYYVNGSAPSGSGNQKYDVDTIDKVIAMLEALGDKFTYDGHDVVLAFNQTICTVTFTVNGEQYKSLNVVAGVTLDLSVITEPAPPENYTFGGWEGADGDVIEITTDVELVAIFNKKQYTITFDADGGTAAGDITDDYDKPLTAPTTDKTGYTLVGWYEDGAETPFDFTAERNGNVSLKAKWTANNYTVTFNANGGGVTPATKQVTYDGKYGELPTPTHSGHKFIGWFESNGTDDDENWGEQITADTVFATADNSTVIYAKWEEVSNRVLLDYNYAGSPEAHEIGVGDNDTTIAINVISRVGYTLMGFATEADGDVAYTTTLSKAEFDELAVERLVTLYAVWQINTYTITVNLNGGEWEVETLTFTVEDLDENGYYDISELTPTRLCHTFEGWTITRNNIAAEHVELSDDYTITANWSEPEHTVQTLEAVDATCTETGLTEGKTCSVCGEVLVAQEVLPMIPHNYEDGECTECGKKEATEGLAYNKISSGYAVTGIGNATDTDIVIPSEYMGEPVVSIVDDAFKNNTKITSLTIGDNVTTIGGYAFNGCSNLTSVVIGNSVTSIGKQVFRNCTSLTSVAIGNSVTTIGQYAFAGCTSLTSIVIPDSVTTLEGQMFNGCTSLVSMVIGSGVQSIGGSFLYKVGNITDVYYNGTQAAWNSISGNGIAAKAIYYYDEDPTESGNYWHYVDGVPTKWEL